MIRTRLSGWSTIYLYIKIKRFFKSKVYCLTFKSDHFKQRYPIYSKSCPGVSLSYKTWILTSKCPHDFLLYSVQNLFIATITQYNSFPQIVSFHSFTKNIYIFIMYSLQLNPFCMIFFAFSSDNQLG